MEKFIVDDKLNSRELIETFIQVKIHKAKAENVDPNHEIAIDTIALIYYMREYKSLRTFLEAQQGNTQVLDNIGWINMTWMMYEQFTPSALAEKVIELLKEV